MKLIIASTAIDIHWKINEIPSEISKSKFYKLETGRCDGFKLQEIYSSVSLD